MWEMSFCCRFRTAELSQQIKGTVTKSFRYQLIAPVHTNPDFFFGNHIFLLCCPSSPVINSAFGRRCRKTASQGREDTRVGLVPRNDVLTNGFIWFSLARTLARILFVLRLRPPWETQKALRTWRRLFVLFDSIRSWESLYKFCHCSSLSQLMMLALENSEKC